MATPPHDAETPRAADEAPALAVARWLGRVPYEPAWRAMQRLTETRAADAPDELWCLEHPPVYTLGLNGRAEHVLAAGDIPVVNVDRGGQVTYHGPGQLVVYPLLDLRRSKLGVRELVTAIEDAIVAYAAELGVAAASRRDAPGVYVERRKLASLGLRIRRGCSYHGLALNVAMDLEPFRRIDPCGYAGLEVVDLATLGVRLTPERAARGLLPHLWRNLRLYGEPAWSDEPAAGTFGASSPQSA